MTIMMTGGKGVLNRTRVKDSYRSVSGTTLTCRQINQELKPLLELFTKVEIHRDTESSSYTYNMDIPSAHLARIKQLDIRYDTSDWSLALIDQLPALELIHFFPTGTIARTVFLDPNLDPRWVDTKDGEQHVLYTICQKLKDYWGVRPQALVAQVEGDAFSHSLLTTRCGSNAGRKWVKNPCKEISIETSQCMFLCLSATVLRIKLTSPSGRYVVPLYCTVGKPDDIVQECVFDLVTRRCLSKQHHHRRVYN